MLAPVAAAALIVALALLLIQLLTLPMNLATVMLLLVSSLDGSIWGLCGKMAWGCGLRRRLVFGGGRESQQVLRGLERYLGLQSR